MSSKGTSKTRTMYSKRATTQKSQSNLQKYQKGLEE